MARLSELMFQSASDQTDPMKVVKGPDIAGAYQKGAALAQQKEALIQKKADLQKKAEEVELQKFEKVGGWMDTYSKMAEGPAKKVFGDKFITSGIKALGLEGKIHPLNQEMMIKDSKLAGAITAGIREGKYNVAILGDPEALSAAYPELVKDAAAGDVAALAGEYRETFDKAEAERGQRAATKTNAEIMAREQSNRAVADDARAGGKKLSEVVATEYGKYASGGGSAAMNGAIENLSEVSKALKTGTVKTGGVSTRIPLFKSDDAQSMLNPEALKLKTQAQSALNSVLRQTLGAQFTAEEGTRVLNQVWDDRLSPTSNAQKLDRKIKELKSNQANAEAEFKRFGYMKEQKKASDFKIPQDKKDAFAKLSDAEKKKALSGLAQMFGVDVEAVKKELGVK